MGSEICDVVGNLSLCLSVCSHEVWQLPELYLKSEFLRLLVIVVLHLSRDLLTPGAHRKTD